MISHIQNSLQTFLRWMIHDDSMEERNYFDRFIPPTKFFLDEFVRFFSSNLCVNLESRSCNLLGTSGATFFYIISSVCLCIYVYKSINCCCCCLKYRNIKIRSYSNFPFIDQNTTRRQIR